MTTFDHVAMSMTTARDLRERLNQNAHLDPFVMQEEDHFEIILKSFGDWIHFGVIDLRSSMTRRTERGPF